MLEKCGVTLCWGDRERGTRALCWPVRPLSPAGLRPAPPLSSLSSSAPPQKVLGLLLAHSADVNARDKLWQTPLHVAAANRATKCAEALAPLLSSLNVADRSGRSALHHAVHSGHLEVRAAPATPRFLPAFPSRSPSSACRPLGLGSPSPDEYINTWAQAPNEWLG